MLTAIDPSSGELIREMPAATAAQRDHILSQASMAFADWRGKRFAERADALRAVARELRAGKEASALLMAEEMGKPVKEGRGEVEKAAWCCEHYADHAEAYLRSESLESDASHSYVQYLPLGTILGILPWNAPFWLAARFFAPALMAGNTCVMKHDPHVPGCAQAISEAFERAGLPEGVFSNLPLATPDVEAAIAAPRVAAVSFTGSDRAGAKVATAAASRIKPAVLELGGSDPCIVLTDADLEKAADVVALSRIINAGQSCIAAKRILVEAPVYERFCGLLQERLGRLKLGDPRLDDTDVGPIARADLRDNLARQVESSIKAGARCELGGRVPDGPGFYYPVTMLCDVKPEMEAFCEETFGPVAALTPVRDEAEALELANQTEYGLAASVWTETARGEALARQIQAGQVSVNGIVKTDPRLPSGGIKRSGYGRELGPHGIHEFVNAQQVWVGPVKA